MFCAYVKNDSVAANNVRAGSLLDVSVFIIQGISWNKWPRSSQHVNAAALFIQIVSNLWFVFHHEKYLNVLHVHRSLNILVFHMNLVEDDQIEYYNVR